ncbi:hypothetical protein VE03_10768, partial [Pseudogymnoascus sp. 23342-1-I1]
MPRPRLSTIEKRRRKAERLARWRRQVREHVATNDPFVHVGPRPAYRPSEGEEDVDNGLIEDEERAGMGLNDDEEQAAYEGLIEDNEERTDIWPIDDEEQVDMRLSDNEEQADFISRGSEDESVTGHSRGLNGSSTASIHPQNDGNRRDVMTVDVDEANDQDGGQAPSPPQAGPLREGRQEGSQDDTSIDFAAKLGQHLLRFQGCGREKHLEAYTRHNRAAEAASLHLPLSGYLRQMGAAGIPHVVARDGFLSTGEREACPPPNWPLAFEGRAASDGASSATEEAGSPRDGSDEEAGRPRDGSEGEAEQGREGAQVCLRCSQVGGETPAEINFDIDSFLGYASSLAFARRGVTINLFPRFHSNLRTNLHLYTTAYHDAGRGERPMKVPLHRVTHYCLGRVLGHEDISIYVFFPRMFAAERATNFPGKGGGDEHHLLRTWTDRILLPAVFRHAPATSRQHLPPSWEQAWRKAEAHYAERRGQAEDENASGARSLSLHYDLHPQRLAAVWEDVKRQLASDENHIYWGAQLFFSSKNTKLRFPYGTLGGAWDAFNSTLSDTLDFAYLDRAQVWIDLGKEVVGRGYALPSEQVGAGSTPTTYLTQTCCQEAFVRWAARGGKAQWVKPTMYPVAMLRDASDLTVEMSRSSAQREQGWVFSQVYSSYKELYDAAKTKPFGSPFLSQLAWDPAVDKMLRQQGKGAPTPASHIKRSYLDSKSRLRGAINHGFQLSYGVREEHRVSLAFLDRVREALQATGDWDVARGLTDADYEHMWELSTADYLMYVALNANKYMAALEWILSLDPAGRVGYEHCKLASMLLQALPFTFDTGPIANRAEIWQEQLQRRRQGPAVLGMGLSRTAAATGYGWLLPRIDWEQLVFRRRIATRVAFANSMLRDSYRKNWREVKGAKGDLGRIEAAGRWLELYQADPSCLRYTVEFILVLLMRSYRKEVFRLVKGMVLPHAREAAAEGRIMLCLQDISAHLDPESVADLHVVQPRQRTQTAFQCTPRGS